MTALTSLSTACRVPTPPCHSPGTTVHKDCAYICLLCPSIAMPGLACSHVCHFQVLPQGGVGSLLCTLASSQYCRVTTKAYLFACLLRQSSTTCNTGMSICTPGVPRLPHYGLGMTVHMCAAFHLCREPHLLAQLLCPTADTWWCCLAFWVPAAAPSRVGMPGHICAVSQCLDVKCGHVHWHLCCISV